VGDELCPDVIAINACGANAESSILVGKSDIYLENRSTITMIALYPDDSGSGPMRSTEILFPRLLGLHWGVMVRESCLYGSSFLGIGCSHLCIFGRRIGYKATNSFCNEFLCL